MDERQDDSKRPDRPRSFEAAGMLKAGFALTPNDLVVDPRISGNAKAMWAIVYHVVHFKDEEPEMIALGALLGGGEKAARGALRELVDAGYLLSKRRGQGKPNLYTLTTPDPQTGPQGGSRNSLGADHSFKDVKKHTPSGANAPEGGRARRRDPVFDALADATHANADASGGMIAKALKAIKAAAEPLITAKRQLYLAEHPEVDEVPKEREQAYLAALIHSRAERYAEMRPDWELTPTALASHWNRIPTWQLERGRKGMTGSELMQVDLGDVA